MCSGSLIYKNSYLNTDLFFRFNNFDIYSAETFGNNWSAYRAIYLCIHKITKQPWVVGNFIHTSTDAPVWNEMVLTFKSCPANDQLQDFKPFIAYGTGGRMYIGMCMSYNSETQQYRILCYPENNSLQYMTHENEVIRVNDF